MRAALGAYDMNVRVTIMGVCVVAMGVMLVAGYQDLSGFSKLGLYFNQDDQGANLAYGEANSDNVDVMLQCAKGSRKVQLMDVASAKPNEQLVLASGAQKAELAATVSTDETGVTLAEATLPVDAPVLQGFRRSGKIAVSLGGAHYGVKARRNEQAAVSSFFTACGA